MKTRFSVAVAWAMIVVGCTAALWTILPVTAVWNIFIWPPRPTIDIENLARLAQQLSGYFLITLLLIFSLATVQIGITMLMFKRLSDRIDNPGPKVSED